MRCLRLGDMRFRRRCNERMQQMLSGGTTLLFVSHNIEAVKNLCDKAVWLDHGEVRRIGDSQEICEAYQEEQERLTKEKKREKREKLRREGKPYDYLIVGAGLYGAVCARELTRRGKRCLVIDKRNHIGGNVYTEDADGIQVHKYGAHIFPYERSEAVEICESTDGV